MRVSTFAPSAPLVPFVRAFVVVEAEEETTRVLLPDAGVVMGLRFRGSASLIVGERATPLADAAFAGMRNTARRIRTSARGGVVVVRFRETGAARFIAEPLHELFGASLALEELVPRTDVDRVSSRLAEATDNARRVAIAEEFVRSRLRPPAPDHLVAAAVGAIRAARGSIRIGALAEKLGISQDPLEKRFRRVVGTSPKQLASILRLQHAVDSYRPELGLARLALDAGYFDQSHFNREFRSMIGEAPRRFFRSGAYG